jgi:hypothetical protein
MLDDALTGFAQGKLVAAYYDPIDPQSGTATETTPHAERYTSLAASRMPRWNCFGRTTRHESEAGVGVIGGHMWRWACGTAPTQSIALPSLARLQP